jgi:Flp pilus assembly protein TadD
VRFRRAASVIGLAASIAAASIGCSAARPSDADVDAYLKARDLYLRGSVNQAAAIVSHIDSRMRSFHQARLLEGKILFFKGSMVDAEKVFRGLTDRRAGYAEAQIWLLRALQAQGRTAEAETLLNSALELNPGDPRLLHLAGMLRLGTNDISGALGFFRRAQDYGAEFAQSYVESARVLYRFGLVDAALADLAVAQSLLPTGSDMLKPVNDLVARIREAKK